MSVVAKFRVQQVKHIWYSNETEPDSVSVTLSPVYSGSEENKAFFAATPSGEITMLINNKIASAQFKPGQAYYVEFTPEPPK